MSTYDPYSIMHYPKWAFAKNINACLEGDDAGCTILPRSGSGIDKNRMGESNTLTSRDTSGIFNYYRDESACAGISVGLCTWRGSNPVTTSRSATYAFTLRSTDTRGITVTGNQIPIRLSLQRRNANGSYTTLKSATGAVDSYTGLASGQLNPGTYRWHVIATRGSGSIDMFPKG